MNLSIFVPAIDLHRQGFKLLFFCFSLQNYSLSTVLVLENNSAKANPRLFPPFPLQILFTRSITRFVTCILCIIT